MDLGSILLILALAILVGLFIARPLLEVKRLEFDKQENEDHHRSMLMAERDHILDALQELDFDHALGKIPEEDYPFQRSAFLQRGANILRELDSLLAAEEEVAAEDRLEASIAARRADAMKKTVSDLYNTSSIPYAKTKNVTQRGGQIKDQDDEIEAILAQRRRARTDKAAGFCPQCGSSIQKSDRFCPRCGSKIG